MAYRQLRRTNVEKYHSCVVGEAREQRQRLHGSRSFAQASVALVSQCAGYLVDPVRYRPLADHETLPAR